MIKAEVFRNEKEGITRVVFQTRDVSPDGLTTFDELYAALLGSGLKRGGYLDSNKFEIEVKDDSDDE
jgi:hypothetical protein